MSEKPQSKYPIQWQCQIEVYAPDDFKTAEVMILALNQPERAAIMVAVEHLMTMYALDCDDFEEALKLLCVGARSNKTMMHKGNLTS